MLRHYILIAQRHLRRNKFYSAINISGLVAGVVCFLLITIYITHDLRYDQYHEKKNRIYRLGLGGLSENFPRTCISGGVMPHALMNAYAGIENVVRFRHLPSLVRKGNEAFFEEKFFFTDSSLFDVFSFRLIEGHPDKALAEPFSIVLSQDAAMKYFGRDRNVTGELLQVDESMAFKVTGVMENIPDYSHFHADLFASASTLPLHPQEPVRTYQLTGWYAHYFHNYILLDENADVNTVAANIREAAKLHSDPEQYELYGTNMGLYLQPLTDVHFNPLYGELEVQADKTILYILSAVAVIILFLACMNYSNINTALSLNRRKEVGMRKTFGALRSQLSSQFIGESYLITFLAFAFSFVVVIALLPAFNTFSGKNIEWTEIFTTQFNLLFLCGFFVAGFAGGVYPALVMGQWPVLDILRKNVPIKFSPLTFRKAVVIFQFTLTITLIAGSAVIMTQVDHMLKKDLGLSSKNVVVLPTHGDPQIHSHVDPLFSQFATIPSVESATICELIPGETVYGIIALFEGQEENKNFRTISIGYDYLKTFSMTLVAGREFSPDVAADTAIDNVIINEKLAKYLGWTPEQAIGKTYDRGGDGEHPGTVIGVVKNFDFNSLKTETPPIVMSLSPNFYSQIALLVNSDNLTESIASIRKAWESNFPTRPFDFRFADEALQQQYKSEEKFGKLFAWFSILAMIIGLLGLGGMLSLELNSRTKEVGIRKVLGAQTFNLIKLLTKDAMTLMVISLFLSVPLSFYLCDLWLNQFSYKLQDWGSLIVISAALVVGLVGGISALQTIRYASKNPVETLRSE